MKHVGTERVVQVIDALTQATSTMTMAEWVNYYNTPKTHRQKTWNVISLEFSATSMDPLVTSPTVVRELDWAQKAWPLDMVYVDLAQVAKEEELTFPKVFKYCLMSVAGCYTDFHIDLGGTSVWYHILRGRKVFWLIPPTEENLEKFMEWSTSGKQENVFLGDTCSGCQRVTLQEGNTFFIPTGWIHAVYTPVDSLVFGGNFLHSLNVGLQLRVMAIEEKLRVPAPNRYPYFHEMQWYVYDHYNIALTGSSFMSSANQPVHEMCDIIEANPILSQYELAGLKNLREWLPNQDADTYPDDGNKKQKLLDSMMVALAKHKDDGSKPHAPRRRSLLQWKASVLQEYKSRWKFSKPTLDSSKASDTSEPFKSSSEEEEDEIEIPVRMHVKHRKPYTVPLVRAKRRSRCRNCKGCLLKKDCGRCHYCRDMKKFGGLGNMKQCCIHRKCIKVKKEPRSPVKDLLSSSHAKKRAADASSREPTSSSGKKQKTLTDFFGNSSSDVSSLTEFGGNHKDAINSESQEIGNKGGKKKISHMSIVKESKRKDVSYMDVVGKGNVELENSSPLEGVTVVASVKCYLKKAAAAVKKGKAVETKLIFLCKAQAVDNEGGMMYIGYPIDVESHTYFHSNACKDGCRYVKIYDSGISLSLPMVFPKSVDLKKCDLLGGKAIVARECENRKPAKKVLSIVKANDGKTAHLKKLTEASASQVQHSFGQQETCASSSVKLSDSLNEVADSSDTKRDTNSNPSGSQPAVSLLKASLPNNTVTPVSICTSTSKKVITGSIEGDRIVMMSTSKLEDQSDSTVTHKNPLEVLDSSASECTASQKATSSPNASTTEIERDSTIGKVQSDGKTTSVVLRPSSPEPVVRLSIAALHSPKKERSDTPESCNNEKPNVNTLLLNPNQATPSTHKDTSPITGVSDKGTGSKSTDKEDFCQTSFSADIMTEGIDQDKSQKAHEPNSTDSTPEMNKPSVKPKKNVSDIKPESTKAPAVLPKQIVHVHLEKVPSSQSTTAVLATEESVTEEAKPKESASIKLTGIVAAKETKASLPDQKIIENFQDEAKNLQVPEKDLDDKPSGKSIALEVLHGSDLDDMEDEDSEDDMYFDSSEEELMEDLLDEEAYGDEMYDEDEMYEDEMEDQDSREDEYETDDYGIDLDEQKSKCLNSQATVRLSDDLLVKADKSATGNKSYKRSKACGTCKACNAKDCRTCVFCLDMKKYGGRGRMKQKCKYKKCTSMFKSSAESNPSNSLIKSNQVDNSVESLDNPVPGIDAKKILHLAFANSSNVQVPELKAKLPVVSPTTSESIERKATSAEITQSYNNLIKAEASEVRKLPNCGECGNCLDKPEFGGPGRKKQMCTEKKTQLQLRVAKLTAQRDAEKDDSDDESVDQPSLGRTSRRRRKLTQKMEESLDQEWNDVIKAKMLSMSDYASSLLDNYLESMQDGSEGEKSSDEEESDESFVEEENAADDLSYDILNEFMDGMDILPEKSSSDSTSKQEESTSVEARNPSNASVAIEMRFNEEGQTCIDLTKMAIDQSIAEAVVQVQPEVITLNKAITSTKALRTLIAGCISCTEISMKGVTAVSKLGLADLPVTLTHLNVSAIPELKDPVFASLIHRGGGDDTLLSSFLGLQQLDVSHTGIGDHSLKLIARHLPVLATLCMNACNRITNAGVVFLCNSKRLPSLKEIEMNDCEGIDSQCLKDFLALKGLPRLRSFNLNGCPNISLNDIKSFVNSTQSFTTPWTHSRRHLMREFKVKG
ncbi:uncharacterized protein [Watersipora subatra]|uniref:uncharacterized protein isoform X2 n=1 Tax=Watersipora subatra TaxID=2589382 RepID=UPI00355AF39C